MDHFAKPTDALVKAKHDGTLHRNFQGYSTMAGKDMLAFGLSAIGRVENVFAQNVKELSVYYRMIDAGKLPIEKGYELSEDDAVREFVIMQLMCNGRVDKMATDRLFGIQFDDYFSPAIASMRSLVDDGLCKLGAYEIAVTEKGQFFLRNIAAEFDAYLPALKQKQIYSHAV